MKTTPWISLFVAALLICLVGNTQAATPPAAGEAAPPFQLLDQNLKSHALGDYAGDWVILYFYPKDDTPGCTREACSFRDNWASLQQLGAVVLGVSLDDVSSHKAFAEKYHLPFPLLADPQGVTAQAYGAKPALSLWAKRYTFIIDPKGTIAKAYLKVDPETHSQQVISDLTALISAQ
ncbi:MAG: peroxiredoxin [Gammaproteobacteria bacterium]|nr:peroxiredoxin [Gammaproteobacteria bacterium]